MSDVPYPGTGVCDGQAGSGQARMTDRKKNFLVVERNFIERASMCIEFFKRMIDVPKVSACSDVDVEVIAVMERNIERQREGI